MNIRRFLLKNFSVIKKLIFFCLFIISASASAYYLRQPLGNIIGTLLMFYWGYRRFTENDDIPMLDNLKRILVRNN